MIPHYAIGDVHGRDDLLALLLERIIFEHQQTHPGRSGVIVYVGDYIDRGARSREVIDRVMRGVPGFETVCLKGNHEDLLLKCVESDDPHHWQVWLRNGGDATAESFGLNLEFGDYDPASLALAVGSKRLKWLEALPVTYRAGNYFFVHAGIVPGRALEDQVEKDLIWIRDRFLESDEDHGVVVVHGHTPSHEPELKFNRIGVDTGATFWGRLTAVALCDDKEPRFLSVNGAPGTGD